MLGLDCLSDSLSFVKTHNEAELQDFYSELQEVLTQIEALCYLLLEEQKKCWLTADDMILEEFYEHALCLKEFYSEILETYPELRSTNYLEEIETFDSDIFDNYVELSFDED